MDTVVADLITLAVRENAPLNLAHQVMREHVPRTPEIERRFQRFMDRVDGLVAYLDEPEDRVEETRLRVRLAVAALDSQIHQIVLDATSSPCA